MTRVTLALVLLLVPGSFGCHRHAHTDTPTEGKRDDKFIETIYARVGFDTGCPAGQVQVQQIGDQSYGVTGCGKRASYSCICMYHVWTSCTQAVCQLDAVNMSATTSPSSPSTQPAVPPAK
jgi:hypothetical protein